MSLVTLGVRDLARARAFYEALGWKSGAAPDEDVVFFQAGCMIVALWGREQLAEDSAVEDSGGWGGITPAYNARSPAEVDAVLAEAVAGRQREAMLVQQPLDGQAVRQLDPDVERAFADCLHHLEDAIASALVRRRALGDGLLRAGQRRDRRLLYRTEDADAAVVV